MTKKAHLPSRPSFDELPLKAEDPKFSAWGLWSSEDELGTLNLLTSDIVKGAATEIRTGSRIPLNLALDAFIRPMNPVRKPCEHYIISKGNANDDELYINTQGASHWDGLRHYPYQETLQYYNGARQDDISGPNSNDRIGIQNIATHGIAGRGVLLDWEQYAVDNNIAYSPFDTFDIPLWQLEEVAEKQDIKFLPGDILFIRTGWIKAYKALPKKEREALPERRIRASCGVEASEAAIRWHWDNQFAAVASDTVAYEAWPSPKPAGVCMHEVFLSGWGMPIGESFDLERLAEECRKRKRWTFFVSSVPLMVPGGVASPANTMAIL